MVTIPDGEKSLKRLPQQDFIRGYRLIKELHFMIQVQQTAQIHPLCRNRLTDLMNIWLAADEELYA